ncbi:DUF3093 domain-containing protein [Nocardioides terrisoli]|uniref:DUF3093 domain-containing protein n=1 Tax=Nocardioides terrisoli TaxID=3388267 RepID=UPI00287BA4B6|nr:DUF3093 domain-containing protein [Nocardioides marmorisolisilvae]
MSEAGVTYAERLRVPLRWWVQATMFLATLWLAFIVATPAWIAWSATAVLVAITYGMFLLVGSAAIEVRDGELCAGAAHIPLGLLGDPEPLDRDGTRRVAGVEADARAFLLLRPYLKRSVRVPVIDPADPTPYWLLSTRRPQLLVDAITKSR